MSNAIIKSDGFWYAIERKCVSVLPRNLQPDRFWAMVMSARSSPALRSLCETAEGERSLARAFWGCATLGLYPDPVLQHIAIVPFKQTATLIPMYQGYVELAFRTGFVKNIQAHPVFAHDMFDYDMGANKIKHKPAWSVGASDSGPIIAAYAIIDTTNGGKHIEVMPISEIEAIKKRSPSARGKSSPWSDTQESYFRMCVKTPLRRAFKYLPKLHSESLSVATTIDEQQERGEPQSIPPMDDDLPPETHSEAGDFDPADIAAAMEDPQ